jgi:hypothetical protein
VYAAFSLLLLFLFSSASEAGEAFDVDKFIVKEKCLPAIWHVSFDDYSNKEGKKVTGLK